MTMSIMHTQTESYTADIKIPNVDKTGSRKQDCHEIYYSPRTSEPASTTDTGGFDTASIAESDHTTSSDEAVVSGDSDGASSDHGVSMCLMYSVAFMLRMRVAVGTRFPVSCTSTRPAVDCPGYEAPTETKPRQSTQEKKNGKRERTVPAAIAPKSKELNEKIERAARSILNKLTMEKFESLYEQLATAGVKTPEHISIIMREIFEKATLQHKFIEMYADLCVRLEKDPRIMEAAAAKGQPNSFRHLLLTQCQAAFEQLLEPQTPNDEALQDDAVRTLRKLRALGNVKLVGQLMNRGMLSSKLLCGCAEELLRGYEVCPEALESLAALLTVTGPTFDSPAWSHRPKLEGIFLRLREIVGDKRVGSRVRFILRDVLDLRAAKWSDCARHISTGLSEVREKGGNAQVGRTPSTPKAQKMQAQAPPMSPSAGMPPMPQEATPAAKGKAPWRSSRRSGQGATVEVTSQATNTPKEKVVQAHVSEKTTEQAPTPVPKLKPKPCCADNAPSFRIVSGPTPVFYDSGGTFDQAAFHWELSSILKELFEDGNVSAAVATMRFQHVPEELQAKVFADILSRAVEETEAPVRRLAFAFAAGLVAAAEPQSTFVRSECLGGTRMFFEEIYEELCADVPRLDVIAASEMVPILQTVFPEEEVISCWPEDLRP